MKISKHVFNKLGIQCTTIPQIFTFAWIRKHARRHPGMYKSYVLRYKLQYSHRFQFRIVRNSSHACNFFGDFSGTADKAENGHKINLAGMN